MDDFRRDSVYLDFGGMPARPKLENVHDFISKKIQLDMTKVNCIQPMMSKARVIIELKSQAYVEELVGEHSLKHTIEISNKEYAVPLVAYDNAIQVRVADLPSYISSETISRHLAHYGEVLSTQEEVWKNFWPGLPTGVRLVRMRIKKPIPSHIPMTTHTAFITYRNQIRTCRYCVRPLHIGRTCNEARKEQGYDVNSRLTAAQVVEGVIPSSSSSQTISPPPSSAAPMQTSDETTVPNTLVTAITDRVMATATKHLSRPSSLSKIPLGKPTEVADPNRDNTAPDMEISDDDETTNTSKRHRSEISSETVEAPFQDGKRKSRSRTPRTHNSSSR